jgi:putative ABC transport system permease protein
VALARRSLVHYWRRTAAAVTGVAFAIVLMNMELGVMNGLVANSTGFVDRWPADVWVMSTGTTNFDMAKPMPLELLSQVKSVQGVAWAEPVVATWLPWKSSAGTEELVEVVALPAGGHLDIPWPAEPAGSEKLLERSGVVVDAADRKRLRVNEVGDTAELWGMRVQVAGFTQGMRSFTTSPYVVVAQRDLERWNGREVGYVAVKTADSVAPLELRDRIRETLPHMKVLTTGEWRRQVHNYWMWGTGLGIAFLLVAGLGLVVGAAVVGQTLYAMAEDQRMDFGMLKALGAGNRFVALVVARQALAIAVLGYLVGLACSVPLIAWLRWTATPVQVTGTALAAGLAGVVLVCILAAVLPARSLARLEPAVVFCGGGRR